MPNLSASRQASTRAEKLPLPKSSPSLSLRLQPTRSRLLQLESTETRLTMALVLPLTAHYMRLRRVLFVVRVMRSPHSIPYFYSIRFHRNIYRAQSASVTHPRESRSLPMEVQP